MSVHPQSMSVQERFESYHRRNPEVYDLIVRFAREVKAKGYRRYSLDSIFHRIRWHYNVERDQIEKEFKVNNDFTSRYARLVMSQEKDLSDFFEVRQLKA